MYGGFGWLYFHVFLFISIYLFNFWFETPPPHVRFKWMTQNQVRGLIIFVVKLCLLERLGGLNVQEVSDQN